MARVVHFEVHVDDMERAKKFYGEVFGWQFEDWSGYVGEPYFGVITGKDEPGIDGALMQRKGPSPEQDQPVNAYVCTMQVEDYDATEELILELGGAVAVPKGPLPGMAWQGYYTDPEGNLFGLHQPDKSAK